ncbi:MAG: DUF938 domain-containing protein [Gammaproteobacteria bacterium]|nr:DUF938 domain-containing protein [Gammaproteobacteria bacterium]
MNEMNKPYSAACDNNRDPIFNELQKLLRNSATVLEIGSGTGQHAVHFARGLPHLSWQCSDLPENHEGIMQWLDEAALPNTPVPLSLDVTQSEWPESDFDAIFSANAIHIMSWNSVKALFRGISQALAKNGLCVFYGPFNYNNEYTSESNARFDDWLKNRNHESGIRNFEDIEQLAHDAELILQEDITMPANNRLLCWQKQ